MKRNLLIPSILVMVALVIVLVAEEKVTPETVTPISREELLGRWRGGDTNGLNCILVFEREKAHILTFRKEKHLSTVHAWYRVQAKEGKVVLGINGEAKATAEGKLEMKLTRKFTHIEVLREATLERIGEAKEKG